MSGRRDPELLATELLMRILRRPDGSVFQLYASTDEVMPQLTGKGGSCEPGAE